MSIDASTGGGPFSVLVVDDHFVVRTGVIAALEIESDIVVVGTADSARAAIEQYIKLSPDVILLDLQLPDLGGIALIGEIRALRPDPKILVFSAQALDAQLGAAMDAGACGYVLKRAPREELLIALRRVAGGGSYLAPELRQRVRELRCGPAVTLREGEVLALVARGRANKEIAADLGISVETVKGYIKSILGKLDVKDRTEAATEAIRRGIVSLKEESVSSRGELTERASNRYWDASFLMTTSFAEGASSVSRQWRRPAMAGAD